MKKLSTQNLGFTLVETLVALSILSLAITGTFTSIQGALQKSSFAKDQITAFYLAQEAVEFIRNKRDSNTLDAIKNGNPSPTYWMRGIAETGVPSDPCSFGSVCRVSVPENSLTRCAGGTGTCPVLNQDINTGLYRYDVGSPTRFNREVSIRFNSVWEAVVTVKITWTSGIFNKTLTVEEYLMNWQS